MSFTSSQIRESGFIHGLADDAADEIEQLESRIAQLEEELAKVTARYNCVRDMTPEDFGNLSSINDDFDSQVDELIKEQQ